MAAIRLPAGKHRDLRASRSLEFGVPKKNLENLVVFFDSGGTGLTRGRAICLHHEQAKGLPW
jgi:hypothetical protein